MFDMDELQEIPSDSDDESKDRTRGLHGKIARMKELCPEDEDDILSPIGSPREYSHLGGRGKFLELKKKLEADQASRATVSSDDSIQPIIQEDVEALLESFKHEREIKDANRSMSIRNDNHPKFIEMYQQIVERDHKILDLEKRIMELDRHVIDLNDTVKQRDKLIGTKNEAVAVVQNKFKRELEESENEMKKTQKTLFEMEKNFGSAQEMWKSEKQRLNSEIESNSKRFKQVEESNKKLEAIRFELTTKLAEFQETLVLQQGDKERIKKLEEELENKISDKVDEEEKVHNLTEQLEKANGQLAKMKAQFVAKLKAVKEQQVDANQDKVKELENKLAELEEEKGNLLLNLVDYEELQAKNKTLKERINDLENEAAVIDESNNQLNVSMLEMAKEKELLSEESKSKEEKEYELSTKIEELEVALDLQTMENCEKMNALKEEIERIISEKKAEEDKSKDLEEKLEKSNGQLVKMKAQFQAKLKSLKEKQIDTANVEGMKELENRLAELEEEKGNLLLNLVDFEEQIVANTKLKEKINEMEEQSIAFAADAAVIYQSNNELNESIADLMKEKETLTEEFEDIEKTLSAKIQELQNSLVQKQNESDEKTKVIEELGNRPAQVITSQQMQMNTPESSSDGNQIQELTEKLEKANGQLVKMKAQFQAKLRAIREKQAEAPNQDTIRELENRLAELEDEKGNLLLRLVDFEEQEDKKSSRLEIESKYEKILEEKEAEKMRIEDELNQLAAALGQKNSEVESLMKNVSDLQSSLESRISELTTSVNLKDEEIVKAISQYDMFYAEAQDRILYLESQLSRAEGSTAAKFDELNAELNMGQSQKSDLEEMVNMLKQNLTDNEGSISTLNEQINKYSIQLNNKEQNEFNFQEMLNKSEISIIEKENEIIGLREEIANLQESLNQKEGNADSLNELIAELKLKLFSSENKITSLNDKLDELEEELRAKEINEDALKESVRQFKSTLFENENRFSPLHEKIAQLEDSLRSKEENEKGINDQLQEMNFKLSTKEKLVSQYNEKIEEMTEILKTSDENKISLEEMIGQLQDYLSQKDDTISILSDRVDQLTAEIKNTENNEQLFKAQLVDLTKVKSDLMSEVNRLEKSVEEKEGELRRGREDSDCLQTEQMNEMNELKKKISSLMDQFNDVENEMSSLNERLKDSEQVRGSLEEKLRLYDTTENIVFEKNEEILQLQEKLKEMMEKHQLELETNFVKYSDEMELVYEQLGNKAEETNNLQIKLKSVENQAGELDQLENKLKLYQDQLNFANAEIGNLKSDLIKSNSEIEGLRICGQRTNEDNRMQAEMEAAEFSAKIRELEQEAKSLQRKIDESGETLKEVYSQNEGLVKESRNLKEENLILKKENEDLIKVKSLIKENENLIKENEDLKEKLSIQPISSSSIEEAFTMKSSKGDNFAQIGQPFASSQPFMGDNFGQMDPIPMIPMYNVQTGGFGGSGPLLSSGPPGGTDVFPTETIDLDNGKDDRIYELEVQLAELNITIEDLQSQLKEYSEIMASLEILSFQNDELKQENSSLKGEIDRRQREESLKSQIQIPSPTTSNFPPSNFPSSEAVEETVVKSVAYETTELATKQAGEIRELKVKNGKMIQKFKQLKDKYDQLMKENGNLKDKKEFSLEGAIENELMEQVKEKDQLLEEKEKLLGETEKERARLSQKADVLARANDRFTEMKENQDRIMEQLYSERRSLEEEVSGLKWKLEEVENRSQYSPSDDQIDFSKCSSQNIQTNVAKEATEESEGSKGTEGQSSKEEDGLKMMSLEKEVTSLRHHNALLSEELLSLQEEIGKLSEELNASVSGLPEDMKNHMEKEREEKCILERKVDLLQEKISEIEVSEIKSFEEALMLKSWTRQLELDNIKYQKELQQVYSSLNEGEVNHIKMKALQEEVFRLVGTVQDRDRRCEELTAEITRLLEERDTLQLKLSNVLKHNVSLHEEMNKGKETPSAGAPTFDHEDLRKKLAELEESNYSMVLDLRREREARRVVQEQLFFSQTTRAYRLERERQRSPTNSTAPSLPPSPYPLAPPQTQWGTSRPHSPMPNIPSEVPFDIDDESDEGRNSPQKVSLTPPPPSVVHI